MTPSSPVFSRVGVPASARQSVLEFLQARFAHIPAQEWQRRLHSGLVQDVQGRILREGDCVAGLGHILYQRAVPHEAVIPFEARILFQNAHFLVADKPHFLPVMPAGQYVQQTLLYRLQQQTGIEALTPLHRIDRDTAGLVLFSIAPESRNAYHALFRDRQVRKSYAAIAAYDARFEALREHRSHMAKHPKHFFLMQEAEGVANSHSRIRVAERLGQGLARYHLEPVSGKHHQLRVHMAALGIPILNDPYYPVLSQEGASDYDKPLQLLAQRLSFKDPISGLDMQFESQLHLAA